MGKDVIMPGIGCLQRRLYIEQRQTDKVDLNRGIADPCIMCTKRSNCVKPTVNF